MVMEVPPSPQSVGREFVRQYYTLLNKAPDHLHRFYNNQSSFVHGGLDPPNRETIPVVGQKQIHQKIQQLNFHDCHAKITQVDSQATLGNGVVVQVTGELSNAGQPMRRFTQTFVLAAQSPKKYYVHNDIFRYQDEIISDEDCDDGVHSETEEDVSSERQVLSDVPQPINQPTIPQYYNPNAAPIQPNIPQVPLLHNQPPPHVLNPQQIPTVNGAVHPEDINVLPGQVPAHVPSAQTQVLGAPLQNLQQGLVQAPLNQPPVEEPEPQVSEEPLEEPLEANYTEPQESEPEAELPTESASNEPKTYANLLKSGNAVPYNSSPSQISLPVTLPIRSSSPPVANINQTIGSRNNNGINNRGAPRINQQQPRMTGRPDIGRSAPGRNSINEDSSFDERRRLQAPAFSDVNQLFLGNLPHTATESELREIFGAFGNILDLRVHSKPANKVGGAPGGRAPPNYGFITYETQLEVQTCLQAKPIYYPKDDKNGTSLNVEEKKTKDRPSYRPNGDNNRGRGDNPGQRRGVGGPGGPSRTSTGGPGGIGGPNNRNNTYNNRSNGPPNRGQSTYNRR